MCQSVSRNHNRATKQRAVNSEPSLRVAVLILALNEALFFSAWIGSLSIAICQCCEPLAGSLVNRFGCRKVSITGRLICAVSLTAASFANNLVILHVFYAVFGVGAAGVFVSGLEIVRKSFDKRESIALGIVAAGQGAGTTALSQVLQSLVAAVPWRSTLRIFSGALFLNSFIGILYDSKIESTSINEVLSSGEAGQRRTSKRFTFHFSVWKVPSFVVAAASFFFIMLGRSIIYLLLVSITKQFLVLSSRKQMSDRLKMRAAFVFLPLQKNSKFFIKERRKVLITILCRLMCKGKRLVRIYL